LLIPNVQLAWHTDQIAADQPGTGFGFGDQALVVWVDVRQDSLSSPTDGNLRTSRGYRFLRFPEFQARGYSPAFLGEVARRRLLPHDKPI
jgi:hypothetical protein